jgi:MFS family permease
MVAKKTGHSTAMARDRHDHNVHGLSHRRPEVRTDLRKIFTEGIAFSVMVGIGESYLPAFVLALGMGEVASGLIATLPLVAGGLLQLGAPLGVRAVGSHRRWAALCAAIQASAFIPLVAGAVAGKIPGVSVFIIAAIYWASGMALSPAWNVWVERLVPAPVRTRYFARRTSAANLGILAGLLVGALVLDNMPTRPRPLLGFAILFAIASLTRFTSAAMLRSQKEAVLPPMQYQPGKVLRLMRQFPKNPGGTLLVYMLALTMTVTIASPFFTAFMLRQLEMSYSAYMFLIGTALATKVIVLPLFGRLARRVGLRWLLRAAWMGTAAVPALWLISSSYTYLIGLQIFAGAAWGAHEFVTFLLLFEMIGPEERGTLLTAYNFGFALASAGGSLVGGFVFDAVGGGITGYHILFGASSIARASCLAFLLRVPGMRLTALPVVFRSIAVRPSTGVLIRPILATLRHQRKKAKRTK